MTDNEATELLKVKRIFVYNFGDDIISKEMQSMTCNAGRKADERPVRFRLDTHEYMVEEVLDQCTGRNICFSKFAPTMVRFTFCATTPRCLTGNGIWFRFGHKKRPPRFGKSSPSKSRQGQAFRRFRALADMILL
jgi:hypothetical protein